MYALVSFLYIYLQRVKKFLFDNWLVQKPIVSAALGPTLNDFGQLEPET